MNFAEPAFLLLALLALPVLVLAWRSRAPLPRLQLRLLGVLQAGAVLCAAMALAGPWWATAGGPAHRAVVWAAAADGQAPATLAAVRDAAPQRDPFHLVRAGATPRFALPGAAALPAAAGTPDVTAALRAAALAIPDGARALVVVCSDGAHDGEPLALAANELTARGIPVEVRAVPAPPPAAVRLLRVRHAPRIGAGEALRVHADVVAGAAGPARLEVHDGGMLLTAADLVLRPGEQQHHVDVVLQRQGVVALDVRLVHAGAVDQRSGRERTGVLVDGGLRVLHLAADASRREALAASLQGHGVVPIAVDPAAPLDAGAFANVGAVLVDDLPAAAWPQASQQALREHLLAMGTGLVLAGTHSNLGPGGYAGSPLTDILPVRMPQREERRDPSVSLVLIVDTSGSMGGGRLELGKEVARLALQKLQPHDKAGLIEFHGSKRWAAPLQPATNTIEITRALNRLQVGGGTIIYAALEEAYYALLNAQTRFQHVVVLTDGGVESGPFEALARRMAAAGQTVSTVLIGPQANSPFLQNLAQWGRGRFYACPDKFQLPDLQFREPQSALLPAVQERRVPLVRAGDAEATAAFVGDALPPSGGIVEAGVRDGAEVLLRGSAGEPYLVGWDQGAGRVLVLAGQAIGPHSGELHDDPAYGAFLADLLRSAAGGAAALVPQLHLVPHEAGLRVQLQLPAEAELPAPPAVCFPTAPAVPMVFDGRAWTAFLPWTGDAAAMVEVRAGGAVLALGAACAPYPRERRTPDRAREFADLAAVTGGGTADLLAEPREASSGGAGQVLLLAPWCTGLALALFLVTLCLRRVPFERRRSGAAAWPAALAVLCVAGLGRAQETTPGSPADEAAVRAAIDAELRAHGDLAGLRERWRQAPALHRYWLARASGDLAEAVRVGMDPSLATSHRDAVVQMLDGLGRPAEALAALGAIDDRLPPLARAAWLLRRAVLQVAVGDRPAAERDLQAAVAAAGQPAFAEQAGGIAGAFGFFDLALQWCVVSEQPGRAAFQSALRRGLWQQRAGRLGAAAAEYELACQRALLQRDRAFALAQLVAVHRAQGTIAALADGWLARARGAGPSLQPVEFAALGEALRELGRAADGVSLFAAAAATMPELGELALTLAIEAGQPDAAIARLQRQLTAAPADAAVRCSLAMLLADEQRDAEAAAVLREGIREAGARDLRRLCAAASELGMDALVHEIAGAFAAGTEAAGAIEGALLEVAHLRRQGNAAAALERLRAARAVAASPADRLRLAEQFESLGATATAIELYEQIWAEAATEDTGMRLAWLLSESKAAADRQRAWQIFRSVWTTAGSAARRVQAEEHVLDLAAREGNLADLALELEATLADPAAPNRPAVRDALVKIHTRARDTTGAALILGQWAKEEPDRQVEALQQLARVHLSAEEFRAHERTLLKLLALDPEGELDYRQQLAMSALERGRPEDARQHIADLLGKPGTPDTVALEFSAGIQSMAAQHGEAVRLYRRALALHPERVETFLLLGNALRAAGQREAAIGTFQELLLRPLPDDLFVVAVDGLLNMEAPAAVLAAAGRAVRLRLAARPDQVFLHRVLQDLLEAERNEPARLQALEDTVVAAGEQRANFVRELMQEAEQKRDWRAYVGHGRALLMLGDEVPPAVYLSLGEALLHLGDIDAAARSFARARLGADFAAVEARTAELYENAGRLAEAERLRVRLLRRTPDAPGAMLAVARLAERQGKVARALPHWLAAARLLLPAELEVVRATTGSRRVLPTRAEPAAVTFQEAFLGVLRCAATTAECGPLLQAIVEAARAGPVAGRLTALRLWRQIASAFADAAATAAMRAAEDALLAEGGVNVRPELRARRLLAGDLDGAMAIARTGAATMEELRLLLLTGDAPALAEAAGRSAPDLLPDLAGMLQMAGRVEEAKALLPLLGDRDGDEQVAQARDRLRAVLGMPRLVDVARAERRLADAMARDGALVAKVNAVFAALRELPEYPAGQREACVRGLADTAVAQRDAAAAERLLANARTDLDPELAGRLVDLVFRADRVVLAARVEHLAAVPVERAVELVRGVLRTLQDEQRRMQLLQFLCNPAAPEPVQLALVGDCDPRGVQGTDRLIFTSGLERARGSPSVLKALAGRFATLAPDDPLTKLLAVRTAGDGAAQRAAAIAVLPALATRRLGDRDEVVVAQIVRALTADDAKALLGSVSPDAPLALRIALLQRAGDRVAAADAFLQAHAARPDDVSLLYRAASYCEAAGLFERAAELYRRAKAQSPTFYPYQAQQLARLELLAGNARAALDALRAARDPTQINFRLALRAIAAVPDAAVREAALADILQQKAARPAGSATLVFSRLLGRGAGAGSDRLAAALAPVRLPPLAPQSLEDAEAVPSDYDLLAFVPEGERVARTLLRTADDAARAGDLGLYRGLLGAARRAGRGQALVDAAVATLRAAPFDAEALRVVFAGAQIGLQVEPALLRRVLGHAASDPRWQPATIGAVLMLAGPAGEPALAQRMLTLLLQRRGMFADATLRPWLPGLFALACAQMPDRVLELAAETDLDSDAAAELAAGLVLHHQDAGAAARAVAAMWAAAPRPAAPNGSDLLPRCGAHLLAGDVDAALRALALPGTFWPLPRDVDPHRFAAAVPPLERWASTAGAANFAEGLLATLGGGDDQRLGCIARVAAVLAARLAAHGEADAAARLRERLRAATAGLVFAAADWLDGP